MRRPSGLNDAAVTRPGARSRSRRRPLPTAYTLALRRPPTTMRRPSGLNPAPATGPPTGTTSRSLDWMSAVRRTSSMRGVRSIRAAESASWRLRNGSLPSVASAVAASSPARACRAADRAWLRWVSANTATTATAPSATSDATARARSRLCLRDASLRSRSSCRRARQASTGSASTSWKIS